MVSSSRPPGRRRIAWVLLPAIALGCGRGQGSPAGAEPPPITLAPENVTVVAERTLVSGPEVSGALRAKRAAALRAEVPGTVLEVSAEAGEPVRAGQVLARVDEAALQDALLAARSGLSAARNGVALAESNARRARTLAEAGALAVQQAEQAESQLEAARAQLADAKARLAGAELQAGKTRVRAPFAGIVSERQVSAGDVVAPGSALFTVVDPARLQLEAAVPAARIGQVKPGARVDFVVTGFDEVFGGEIERVNPAVDPATGQVRIYVDVPNADGRLISGLYAEGRVATLRGTGPAAPTAAVDTTTSPPTVMKVQGGRAERVPVELGLADELAGAVSFRAGVEVGDVLVLGSARASLADGAAVELAPPRERAAARRPPSPAAN